MKLRIKTPSRLHLGLIDLNGNLGRLYGSMGVAIDSPNVVLEAGSSDCLELSGLEKDRVAKAVSRFSEYYNIDPEIRLEIKETIPKHSGLGSGTQLSLAVGTALARVHGIDAPVRIIASVMGRGFVSGTGVSAFERGGFSVDGGLNVLYQTPPQTVFHHGFPRGWVFVVAVPKIKKGLSGKQEKDAFRGIIPGPEKNAADISRLVLMKLLPSLLEKDIEGFGYAITEIDRKTGEYYKDIPCDRTAGSIMRHMTGLGAHGAGQSSWGPAVYGLIEKKYAPALESGTREYLSEKGIPGIVYVAVPDNKGAFIGNVG
ncbi:MAG: beta-ribofuranosylaminobenzene 5'-phosphate synthase family protein [Candidatus Altiarchaeia archaeon]